MPDAAWLTVFPMPTRASKRALGTAKRIMDKPTDIHIQRNGAFLLVQTVRIEGRGVSRWRGTREGSNSTTYDRDITVFGVKDHPSLPDVDIQVGDRFGYNGDTYIVNGVTLHAGEVQAACDRIQQ